MIEVQYIILAKMCTNNNLAMSSTLLSHLPPIESTQTNRKQFAERGVDNNYHLLRLITTIWHTNWKTKGLVWTPAVLVGNCGKLCLSVFLQIAFPLFLGFWNVMNSGHAGLCWCSRNKKDTVRHFEAPRIPKITAFENTDEQSLILQCNLMLCYYMIFS